MSSEPEVVVEEVEGNIENNNNTEHNHHDNQVYDHPQRNDSLDMESRNFPSSTHASKVKYSIYYIIYE